ncbi:MAG: IS66 family insertion sequence element accessory protein TnpB [Gammaproteobacteria bacterium]|nr:IS66 family insertion sequence element accessory protein TnpB [Gammaproteobacteria bacterium]
MISFGTDTCVYLAAGATDMRKAVNGLMILVEDVLEADPFSSHRFVFCNRLRDKIKILYWHNNGFWLFYRRIEKQRFWWPIGSEQASLEITSCELSWLLEGLDITQVKAHKTAKFPLF